MSRAPKTVLPTRILLVDDNKFGNVARKTLLTEQGFTVDCVLSGEEALEMYGVQPYELIVTDLKMTGMGGLELIAHLRKLPEPPLIILLSGLAGCLGLTEQTSGADAVLEKSCKEQEQLLREVRQLLARRKPVKSERSIKSSVARSG